MKQEIKNLLDKFTVEEILEGLTNQSSIEEIVEYVAKTAKVDMIIDSLDWEAVKDYVSTNSDLSEHMNMLSRDYSKEDVIEYIEFDADVIKIALSKINDSIDVYLIE